MKHQLNEVQKLQKVAGISKIKLKEDSSSRYQDLLNQLRDLASSGEIDNNDISNINIELLSARKKMFAGKKSPEQRSASLAKGKITKQLNKISDLADTQVATEFGLLDKDGMTDNPDSSADHFALSINMHKDKKLQKKFNDRLNFLILKYAKEAGITDEAAINSQLDLHK